MSVSPFKERFSLSWLAPPDEQAEAASSSSRSAPPPSSYQFPSGMEAVLSSIGSQVLTTLRSAEDRQMSLFNLARASSMRLEALLPILQYLTSKNLIERTIEDPSGDDTYKLTAAGLAPQPLPLA